MAPRRPVPVEGRDPERVRMFRFSGFKLPATAMSVTRPTRWGNPYRVGYPVFRHQPLWLWMPKEMQANADRADDHAIMVGSNLTAVEAFTIYLHEHPALRRDGIEALRGFDLACWCKLDEPCHADVWLEVANA